MRVFPKLFLVNNLIKYLYSNICNFTIEVSINNAMAEGRRKFRLVWWWLMMYDVCEGFTIIVTYIFDIYDNVWHHAFIATVMFLCPYSHVCTYTFCYVYLVKISQLLLKHFRKKMRTRNYFAGGFQRQRNQTASFFKWSNYNSQLFHSFIKHAITFFIKLQKQRISPRSSKVDYIS